MTNDHIFRRNIFWLGLATYLVLGFMSVLYYKERVIFLDAAYQLFSVLKNDSLAVQIDRYVVFFTQGTALLASRAGFSLQGIMVVYSLSFVLLQCLAFCWAVRLMKQPAIALCILFFSVFMMSHTFYWIQSEYLQGMSFLLALGAWLLHKDRLESVSALGFAGLVAVLHILVYAHPLMFIPFCYLLFYFIINDLIDRKLATSTLLIFAVLYFIKKFFFAASSYDSQSMEGLSNFIRLFPHYFDTKSFRFFWWGMLCEYYLVGLAFLVMLGFYIKTKQYARLAFLFFSFWGYALLVNISFPRLGEWYHLESFWTALSVIVFLPFCFELLPLIPRRIVWVGLPILLVIRLFHINYTHYSYTDRLNYYRDVLKKMEQQGDSKVIAAKDITPKERVRDIWATAYEFLYLSSLESDKMRSILFEGNLSNYSWARHRRDAFIAPWEVLGYADEFPNKYFAKPDTSLYRVWEK